MKKFLSNIYVLVFMAITVVFSIVIWNVTFAHIIEEYHHRQEVERIKELKGEVDQKAEKPTFEKIILESEERVKHYLGYRILETQRIEGHFHHIGFDVGPDRRSYCSTCHGDMPHDAVKDIRAFLNMHAFFIACQTCHVQLEGDDKTGIYKWYDRESGEIVDSPVQGNTPGIYQAKILPFVKGENGDLERIDSDDMIDFARSYRENEKTLSEVQKSKAKKMVHKIVSKKPYQCEDCHQKENPLLPFADIGYPKERIDSITSTEVVGMIKNYTKFHMPKMLTPGEAKKSK